MLMGSRSQQIHDNYMKQIKFCIYGLWIEQWLLLLYEVGASQTQKRFYVMLSERSPEHLFVSDQHHSLTSTAAALTGWTAAVFSWTGGGFFIVATGGTSFTGSSPYTGQQGHNSSLHPTVQQIQTKLWESQRMILWAKVMNKLTDRKTTNRKI